MNDRTRLGIQVWVLADKYKIPQTTVHDIINSYLAYCKDLLLHGERVDFFGLVSIIPNYQVSNFAPTLAYNCEKVANKLGLPQHTVFRVMNAYIEDAIESIQNGTTVEIRGLVVCTPIWEGDKLAIIHSNISQSLKNILVKNNTKVTSLRVHTYKSLRDKISSVES